MTLHQYEVRKRLLYEERIGVHLRSKVTAKSSEYAQSVARLRAAQAREEERTKEP